MSDIVIYGKGKTGLSLYRMLNRQGRQAVFYDDTSGFDGEGCFDENTLVLLSPGVKPFAKGLIDAKKAGATIMSELEYCFSCCAARCVSVTGTNGKTTVCEMIYRILREAGIACRLLGNGGRPFSSEVLDVEANETVVLESSSFQLNDAKFFAPYISVFTSLACDHLDYHASYDEYVNAKANNFLRQRKGFAIFNADDKNVVELSARCQCEKLYYSVSGGNGECFFDGDNVVLNVDGQISRSQCPALKGFVEHNRSNALAAILTAYLLGVPISVSARAIVDYRFLPHRIETVGKHCGVTFVDDSKATNVHAAVSALSNYTEPLALILGGSDKGERFDGIFENISSNVMAVTASGETASKIAECGRRHGVGVAVFDVISQACGSCYCAVKPKGGVVLMSNACASFDKFGGYAERGDYFKQVVERLIGDKKTD